MLGKVVSLICAGSGQGLPSGTESYCGLSDLPQASFNPSTPLLSDTRCFVCFPCTCLVMNGEKKGVEAGQGISVGAGILVEINQIIGDLQPKPANVRDWSCPRSL